MSLSRVEDPHEQPTSKVVPCKDSIFLTEEVIAQQIDGPVEELPQTNRPKERKR
jgi:hypothetical protein